VWQHSTLIIPSQIARRGSNTVSIQKLPDSVAKSVATTRHRQSMCQAKRSIYRSVLRLVVDFLHTMHMKGKQTLVFNFIFDLLRTGSGFSVRAVVILVFREIN